ncbi:Imm45 family immunity protein [Ectopseudomonas hydrolytica]|uniref:Imm45 family immunity protein n=1 Tax=Ectopseudomonas hydrolytica TaxID=2493633 RepID=UPI0018A77FD7|nr:Imm45 family immunity protein [Pseudomonas hydrolytica]MBF8164060.1 hypothetical protein [Pseudomonas mendocina]UTH33092.1 Imm45 family immunity protein [Pseudomonas hydrolytica]UZZ12319.1 Imm45 family immunity protein [Pseudomonas mendocina]
MNWRPFANCKEKSFGRGVVFRFPAKAPFEKIVDFMIIEEHDSPTFYKLICSSGHHAGQTELVFPAEAKHETGAVSVAWLKKIGKLGFTPSAKLKPSVTWTAIHRATA